MKTLETGAKLPRDGAAGLMDHTVQFYESEEYLAEVVAGYVGEGLGAGERAVLIVTPANAETVSMRLEDTGIDVDGALRAGQLKVLDARETLSSLLSGTAVDEQSCHAVLERAIGKGPADSRGIRVFGEMVSLLWREGNAAAAIRLEEVWSELAERLPFSLMCAYPLGNFYRQAHVSAFDAICARHTRVVPAESYARASDGDRGREVSRLQQRARALETEVEHRRALEKALRNALVERRREAEQAERASRAKTDFLAVMSHELRTPLNAIFGYEGLLAEGMAGPVTSRQKVYLERIRRSADQLLTLIDQVLHLARIEAGREEVATERVDIGAIIRDALQMIEPGAKSRSLKLSVREPDEPVFVWSDPGKLRQILINLLSNAVKFTTKGGISVVIRREDRFIAIDVSDTGIGIAAADLERVFEPFVQVEGSLTRSYGGTGLGLSVSRDLARVLGGTLTCVSRAGQGSTFTLHVPFETAETLI